MSLSPEVLEKVKKNNLGRIIYAMIKIKNEDGCVINESIGNCIGKITDIDTTGNFTIINPFSKEKTILNVLHLNKNLSEYCLRKELIRGRNY